MTRRGEQGFADRRSAAQQARNERAGGAYGAAGRTTGGKQTDGRDDSREPNSAPARPVAQPPRASTRAFGGTIRFARRACKTGYHPLLSPPCAKGAWRGSWRGSRSTTRVDRGPQQ